MKRPGIVALAVSLTLAVHRWLAVRREWKRLRMDRRLMERRLEALRNGGL